MSKSMIKIISSVLIIILILGTTTGLIGYYSNWFTNWDRFNPKNWFNKDQNEEDKNAQASSGSILNNVLNNGVLCVSERIAYSDYALKGISETADSAYELTATIQPSIAENKNVVWSARWNNIGSDWAKDKDISNYVTFDKVTSQSGENVIVTFLNDFGEQILITASAEADNTKKAICSVDYQKRIKSVRYSFKYNNNVIENVVADSDGVYRFDYKKDELKLYTAVPTPIYSNYTIDCTYDSIITGNFTDTFGFGGDVTLNSISLLASLNISEEEIEYTDNAKWFCFGVQLFVNETVNYDWETFVEVLGNTVDKYNSLTAEEKKLPLVITAKKALDCKDMLFDGEPLNSTNYKKIYPAMKEVYANHVNPTPNCTFLNGIEISSIDTFFQNCINCNNANKGVVEYLIKYSNGNFVYDFKLSLGFTSSSLQAVIDVELDNGEIII